MPAVPGSIARRRAMLAVGGVLAFAFAAAPAARADFTLAPCTGAPVQGSGSSFQNDAMAAFIPAFASSNIGCGVPGLVSYTATGSGPGRQSLGERDANLNPNDARDATYRFAGSDQAPNATQRTQIEQGPVDGNFANVTTADDNPVNVIPIAIGAVAIPVNLPAGCDYTTNGAGHLFHDRPEIPNTTLEKIFAADPTVTNWNQVITWGINCSAPIQRVVRLDSSGTTFALKQFLANINPNRGWAQLANQAWPNDSGSTAVVRADAGSGSSLRAKLIATPGSIGYTDLATTRKGSDDLFWSAANDRTFWLPVEVQSSGTYQDPQADPNGYQLADANSPNPGANCNAATPHGALPTDTKGDWSAVDYTYSATAYGACTLTYDLVFDDDSYPYCNSAAEQAQARTLNDFFTKVVTSDAGQALLPGAYYDKLPTDALQAARAGANSIGWEKTGAGRPCPTTGPPPTGGGGGGGGTGTGTTPPPSAPSNKFTIASGRVTTKSGAASAIRISLSLPGAGKLLVASTAKPKKGKSIKLSTKNVTVTKAGSQVVSISLSSKAKSALKKSALKVTLKITFTPTGGTANTVSKSVTVKQTKKKTKKK